MIHRKLWAKVTAFSLFNFFLASLCFAQENLIKCQDFSGDYLLNFHSPLLDFYNTKEYVFKINANEERKLSLFLIQSDVETQDITHELQLFKVRIASDLQDSAFELVTQGFYSDSSPMQMLRFRCRGQIKEAVQAVMEVPK